jgi:hypothetical protein
VNKTLDGLCPDVDVDPEGDQGTVRGLARVTLGNAVNNCVAAAKILEVWEGDGA